MTMQKLSELCASFLDTVDEIDPADAVAYGTRLDRIVKKLALNAAEHVGEHDLGEISALMARCHGVLAWLAAEAEDINDRQRRYGRQQAVLNLCVLCESIRRYYTGRRKPEDVESLQALVSSALATLVVTEEE